MFSTYNLKWLSITLPSMAIAASLPRRAVPEAAARDLCGAHSGRVAIARDTLYFTGAEYTFRGGDTERPVSRLFSIPLNNSFPVDGPLPSNNYYGTSSPAQSESQGAFFQDANETMLYSFGGYSNDRQQPMDTLNAYNITSGEWSNITVSGGSFNYFTRAATSRAITTGSSEALGFVSGGWNDLGGMIRFDASDPANPEWRNETDNNPPLTLEGSMDFIRLGPRGSLISFGGYNKDYVNPELEGWSYDHRPMDQISVYDIDSATWFNVTAGGDIPRTRSAFCTAVSSAPDDSSFQITMYAGWDLFGNHSVADTYVLSIPSFQWIDVTDSSNVDALMSSGDEKSGRDHHQCVAYKDRQMLVLGGLLRIGPEIQNMRGCNRDHPAVRALDLSTFRWYDDWNGSPAPYFVPEAVTRIIGGSRGGGATMKQPNGGFNDSALNTIFGQVSPRYVPPAVSATSTRFDYTNTDGGVTSSPRETNVASIVGGVVGAVGGLAIIITIAFILLRRRRKRRAANSASDDATMTVRDTKPAEMSAELQGPQLVAAGEYYKPPITGALGWVGDGGAGVYGPISQNIDSGYPVSLMGGDPRVRPLGELPG